MLQTDQQLLKNKIKMFNSCDKFSLHRTSVLLFLLCIGVRTSLTVAAAKTTKKILPWLSVIGFTIGFGFLFLSVGITTRNRGVETGGREIWWKRLRPVFAVLYLNFAVLALVGSKYAYIPLALDVFIGVCAFFIYHFILHNNNFSFFK